MAFTRQGYAWPEPCQAGCKDSSPTDQVSGWTAFGLLFTSVCQQCQATTDCKPAPDLDTTQEPAYQSPNPKRTEGGLVQQGLSVAI
jgi:hypothetical protein